MTTQSRRAYDRLEVDLSVTIGHNDRVFEATCRNISQGGMFIETELLPMGDPIEVTFELPDHKEKIVAQATVMWAEREPQVGVGVKFAGLRAIEVWAINQLFRRRSRGEL